MPSVSSYKSTCTHRLSTGNRERQCRSAAGVWAPNSLCLATVHSSSSSHQSVSCACERFRVPTATPTRFSGVQFPLRSGAINGRRRLGSFYVAINCTRHAFFRLPAVLLAAPALCCVVLRVATQSRTATRRRVVPRRVSTPRPKLHSRRALLPAQPLAPTTTAACCRRARRRHSSPLPRCSWPRRCRAKSQFAYCCVPATVSLARRHSAEACDITGVLFLFHCQSALIAHRSSSRRSLLCHDVAQPSHIVSSSRHDIEFPARPAPSLLLHM